MINMSRCYFCNQNVERNNCRYLTIAEDSKTTITAPVCEVYYRQEAESTYE